MHSKTFKLFISSTFHDFKNERAILQSRVFPKIIAYCRKWGYIFQPIDLRWGVSFEAQLDQKTLDLCLNEVRACKAYPDPNFLIMIGDRYGWVPLPYAIEKLELEAILKLCNAQERRLILKWYKEDLNEIPVSYTLKQRIDKYKNQKLWQNIEDDLRGILQRVVSEASLTKAKRRKYFLSATEAEVQEGILGYVVENELGMEKKNAQTDSNHEQVFGFFRDVKNDAVKATGGYEKAQQFKSRVDDCLKKENTLRINIPEVKADDLNQEYLKSFEVEVTNFLKNKIDLHRSKEAGVAFSALDLVLNEQEQFVQKKCDIFYGQKKLRKKIQSYINGTINAPLIIHGPSGIGKSALMAKAVLEAQVDSNKRILYRFVGTTEGLNTTRSLLSSFFLELGKEIEVSNNKDDFSLKPQGESFEQFCSRIHEEILSIDEEIVLFIDAIDQLINDDELTWLPVKLPKNVKIVLSVLADNNYKAESVYYKTLKENHQQTLELEPYDKPLKLLKEILKRKNRTLQKHQKNYFLKQYQKVKRPLYITIAAEEMKFWKSYDVLEQKSKKKKYQTFRNLANSQKGIIKGFISNLHQLHHHDTNFVQRVMGYICASRNGLSESELLRLFAVDSEFILQSASENWHKNLTKELPLVLWVRLFNMLNPFLGRKEQNNETLLYFFHREFNTTLLVNEAQQSVHGLLIEQVEKIITIGQNEDFKSNRWGKLYALVNYWYVRQFEHFEIIEKAIHFLTKNINFKWNLGLYKELEGLGTVANDQNQTDKSLVYFKWGADLTKQIIAEDYQKNGDTQKEEVTKEVDDDFLNQLAWMQNYVRSLHHLAQPFLRNHQFEKALESLNEAYEVSCRIFDHMPDIWMQQHFVLSNELGYYYFLNDELGKAMEIIQQVIKLFEDSEDESDENIWPFATSYQLLAMILNKQNDSMKALHYGGKALKIMESNLSGISSMKQKAYVNALRHFGDTLNALNRTDEALMYILKAKEVVEEFYPTNKQEWLDVYSRIATALCFIYINKEQYDKAEKVSLGILEILKPNYELNPLRWADEYIIELSNLGYVYKMSGKYNLGIEILKEAEEIVTPLLDNDVINLKSSYATVLTNYGAILLEQKNEVFAIKYFKKAKEFLQPYYEKDKLVWGLEYSKCLNNLGICFSNLKLNEKSLLYLEETMNIRTELYELNPEKFKSIYVAGLSNLAGTYSQMKSKEKAVPLLYKALSILKDSHHESLMLKQAYIKSLHDLGFHSFDENDPMITISLLTTGKNELEELFKADASWKPMLLKFIEGLITVNKISGNEEQMYLLNLELKAYSKWS